MITLGVIAAAVLAVTALAACGGDSDEPSAEPQAATLAEVEQIIERRCVQCHAQKPTMKGYQDPPANLPFDVAGNIEANKPAIYQRVVVVGDMPFGNNVTGMTEAERQQIASWAKP